MGRFSGVEEAKVYNFGVYFQPGNYVIRLDAVKCGNDRHGIEFFAVESTILESDNPALKPTTSVSYVTKKDKDGYLSNIKAFAFIAGDCPPDEVDDAAIEMIVSDENPLRGTIMRVQAVNKPTREGNDFTRITWKSAEPEDLKKYGQKAA